MMKGQVPQVSDTEVVETENENEQENSNPDSSTNQGEGEQKKDEWTPPSRDEHTRMMKQLELANKQAKERREELEEIRRKTLPEAERKIEDARAEALASATSRYHVIIAKQAAKAGLLSAGLQGDADDALELVKTDNLVVDENGEVSGLDSEINRIKTKFPTLFAAPKVRKHSDGAPRNGEGKDNRDPIYGILEEMGFTP